MSDSTIGAGCLAARDTSGCATVFKEMRPPTAMIFQHVARVLAAVLAVLSPIRMSAQARAVEELLPFRYAASSGYELRVYVNDVRRPDLDVERWEPGIGISGRYRVHDGGPRSICGDEPRDAERRGEYILRRSRSSLPALAITYSEKYEGHYGGLAKTRPSCPVGDARVVWGVSSLAARIVAQENGAGAVDPGRFFLVLDSTLHSPSFADVRDVHGHQVAPAEQTRGAILYPAGDRQGDEIHLGLTYPGGGGPTASAVNKSSARCGDCRHGGWPHATAVVTTLGHAIHALGLAPSPDNRGEMTFSIALDRDSVLRRMGGPLRERWVFLCENADRCDARDRTLGARNVRLTGSGDDVTLQFDVRRRLSAIGGGWSAPTAVAAHFRIVIFQFELTLQDLRDLEVGPTDDLSLEADVRAALTNVQGYRLFFLAGAANHLVRSFGPACLFPKLDAARIARVTTGESFDLTLTAPAWIQDIAFCPKQSGHGAGEAGPRR